MQDTNDHFNIGNVISATPYTYLSIFASIDFSVNENQEKCVATGWSAICPLYTTLSG